MKLQITRISGKAIHETGLDERIIEFDKANMAEILAEAGRPFPEERRRKGFERSPAIWVAFRDQRVIGYLEYCRSWDCNDDIYISSLQVAPLARGGIAVLSLLQSAREDLVNTDFARFVSAVHKNNLPAIRLYRKLGFEIGEPRGSGKSFTVSAPREILFDERVLRFIRLAERRG